MQLKLESETLCSAGPEGTEHELSDGELSKGEDKIINNALCKRHILKGFYPTVELPPASCENCDFHLLICLCFFCSHCLFLGKAT